MVKKHVLHSPINPDSGLEVIETEMLPTRASTQTAIEPYNKKSQKTVWHEKKYNPVSHNVHDPSTIKSSSIKKEKPTKQSNEEWLADYENAEPLEGKKANKGARFI